MSGSREANVPGLPGMLLVISGPSGVGKTTITRAIEERVHDAMFSVSMTTRAKTAADTEGEDYSFVDEPTFLELEARGEFLETAEVFGKRYGTPRAFVDEHLGRGKLVLLEIDVQGAEAVREAMPGVFSIFVMPPSDIELLTRLRNRKRESQQAIEHRFAKSKEEISRAMHSNAYDVFIVNNQLDDAVERACRLVEAERLRRSIRSGG